MQFQVGRRYRLEFPGVAARVIVPPPGLAPPGFPILVESLIVRSRWYINERGESDHGDAPKVLPKEIRGLVVVPAVAMLFAVYLPAALYLRQEEVHRNTPPGAIWRLDRIYRMGDSNMFVSQFKWGDSGDDANTLNSPFVLYEDDKPLGLGHNIHDEIENVGLGRYSHWKRIGFLFSSSDNSDPRYNGREYWAVLPKTVTAP